MLLPNDIKPELSVYYYASLILKIITEKKENEILTLYQIVKQKFDISLRMFSYCLDWLYLIEAVKVDEKGIVSICT